MSNIKVLKSLISKHKNKLLITYLLFSLETLGLLLRPFFLGIAVNDLLTGSYQGLVILSVVHLVWLLVGFIRHRYDTRTYSTIYVELVTKFLSRKIENKDVSKLSAHSTLAREVVDFFEYDLIYIFEAVYNFLGSIILLLYYDSSIVLICLSILLPVLWLSYLYGKKIRKLNKDKNDELEKQVEIITAQNFLSIQQHYINLRKWQVRISDQEAFNFGFMEILVMIVMILSLIFSNKINSHLLQAGTLIGIYSYVLKFVSSLDTIPYVTGKLSSIKDITHRLKLTEKDL